MSVLMVIDRMERELASPCNRLPFANSIRWLLNDIRLNFDQKRSLTLGLGLRWWSAIDKNIKHRHDVGLRTLWRENKFLSTRFLAIFMSFWTHINYFKFLASHLTISGILGWQLSLHPVNHHHYMAIWLRSTLKSQNVFKNCSIYMEISPRQLSKP